MSDALDENFTRALLGYQLFTYAFLVVAAVMVARITGLPGIALRGRLVLVAFGALAVVIVVRSFPTFDDLSEIDGETAALYLVIRILDVVAMLLIVPAIILFVQKVRNRHRESLSFSVIGVGIVASLISVYIYELISGDSLFEIAGRDYQQGSLLDALYIFGYAVLGTGIVAHWWHQEVSMRQVERLLSTGDDQ